METFLDESTPSVAISLLVGVGAGGESITRLLSDLVSTLPDPLQSALRVIHVKTAKDLPEKVCEAREELTTLANTDHILEMGWQVEGRDTGRIRVQVCVAWIQTETDAGDVAGAIKKLQAENPFDLIRGLAIAASPVTATPTTAGDNARHYLIGPRNAAGEAVSQPALVGSVVGALLLLALPGVVPMPEPTEDRAVTFGLSALHGVIGASRRQLARKLASALMTIHGRPAAEVEQQRFQGQDLAALADDFTLDALLPRLFDPRLFQMGRTEPIPAVPGFRDNGTLEVVLDRAGISLSLPEREETRWSELISRYSRTLDMTLAVRWRRQMESAFRALAESVPRTLEQRAHDFLAGTVHSQVLLRDVLERLKRNYETEVRPLPDPTASLEPTLNRLDLAVATRPRAIDLWMRTALWVLPAAAVVGVLITRLMTDPHENLYGIGAAIILAVSGALGVQARLESARQRILKARDEAVSIILSRQEAILSENALGYLLDLVSRLRAKSQEILSFIQRDQETLDQVRKGLAGVLSKPVEGPVTFEPVLSTPEEYDEAFAFLHPNLDQLLDGLEKERRLSPQITQSERNASYRDWLVEWCDERIVDGAGMSPISFSVAWEIRRRRRGGVTVEQEADALERRAEPLGEYEPGSEKTLRVVPAGVDTNGGGGSDERMRLMSGEGSEREVPSPLNLPLLACWKGALLRAAERKP